YTSTSVILWPGNTVTLPSDSVSVSGVTFRIAIYEVTPFTIVTQTNDSSGNITTTYTGYMPDLINYLQTNMSFIPQIILVPSNNTYDDLIDAVANGMYDMVVADVTVTAAREEIVDFSTSMFDDSLQIIIREAPNINIDWF
ncbi:unnamed protein product, partial [Adineta steineri]